MIFLRQTLCPFDLLRLQLDNLQPEAKHLGN